MAVTNYPDGLSSRGVLLPSSLPLGLQQGKSFFVNPESGNDGFDGGSPQTALSTLERALQLCTAGAGDVVYLMSDGTTATTARITTAGGLIWNKDNTHLIGLCAPVSLSQRARISHSASAGVGVTPLFTLSANGCVVMNIQFFAGYASDVDQVGFVMSGARCYVGNCHIAGAASALPAARAGSIQLSLVGSENVFDGCTIGVDTVTYGANSVVVVAGTGGTGAARNIFRRCLFPTFTDSASHLMVSAAASTFDRWILFEDCVFINAIQSTSTAMTAMMSIDGTGSPAGMVILRQCDMFGATYWVGADDSQVMIAARAGAANSQLWGVGRTADLP